MTELAEASPPGARPTYSFVVTSRDILGIALPAWLDLTGRIDLSMDLRRVIANGNPTQWSPAVVVAARGLRERWPGKPTRMDANALRSLRRSGMSAVRAAARAGLAPMDAALAQVAQFAFETAELACAYARVTRPAASGALEVTLSDSAVGLGVMALDAGRADVDGDRARQTVQRWLGGPTLPFDTVRHEVQLSEAGPPPRTSAL